MSKIGKKLIIIGILLIIISSILSIYNIYEEKQAGKNSIAVLNNMKDTIVENVQNINNEIEDEDTMQVINVNGYDYIGTITIPSLNLELPIMSEYDYDRLKISPCRYYGSIYTNDLIICAHSYKSHFKYINNLNQGDKIIITDTLGIN